MYKSLLVASILVVASAQANDDAHLVAVLRPSRPLPTTVITETFAPGAPAAVVVPAELIFTQEKSIAEKVAAKAANVGHSAKEKATGAANYAAKKAVSAKDVIVNNTTTVKDTVTKNSSSLYNYLKNLGVNGENVSSTRLYAVQTTKAIIIALVAGYALRCAYNKIYGRPTTTTIVVPAEVIAILPAVVTPAEVVTETVVYRDIAPVGAITVTPSASLTETTVIRPDGSSITTFSPEETPAYFEVA